MWYRLDMTRVILKVWPILIGFFASPAMAAERLAVLELSGTVVSADDLLDLSDKVRAGALDAARSSGLVLEIMTGAVSYQVMGSHGVLKANVTVSGPETLEECALRPMANQRVLRDLGDGDDMVGFTINATFAKD